MFGIDCKGLDLLVPFQLQGSTALFATRTPTEDKIRNLYDNRIELTDSNTWDPEGLPGIATVNVTSNASAVLRLKDDVPSEGLRVCATMEIDAGYIEDVGDYCLLSSISTALTDKILLPRIIDSVHIANTTSKNRHCDILPESFS